MIDPKGHRVLLKPIDFNEKDEVYKAAKEMGLILSKDQSKREQAGVDVGTILAIGSLCWSDFGDGEPWAKVGDKVMFAKYGGHLFEDKGEWYVLINDEDLLGVYND